MQNASDSGEPRLSSVANAVILPPKTQTTGSDFGDSHFKAPEQVRQLPYNNKVDCWAFGVSLFFCLTETLPFNTEKTNLSLDQVILQNEPDYSLVLDSDYSESAVDLIKKCLEKDSNLRITMG